MIHAYTYATTKDTGNIALQMTLYVIAMHVNVETGRTYAGIRTLMAEAKVKSDRTMRNYIKTLEEMGFVRREKRTRDNGGNTTDLIELVGFLEWFRTQRGVAQPPARITGGSSGGSKRQDLPTPPVNRLPDPPGKQATGLTNSQSERQSNTERKQDRSALSEEAGKRLIPFDGVKVGSILEAAVTDLARERFGIDRLPFTAAALRQVSRMGVDAEALAIRYLEKAKGKSIRDPSAYLVTMARDEVAKRDGISAGEAAMIAKTPKGATAKPIGSLKPHSTTARDLGDFQSTDAALSEALKRLGQGVKAGKAA